MNDDNSSFLSDNPSPPTPTNNPINPKIMLSTIILLFLAVVAVMCFHSYSRCLSERRRRRRHLLPLSDSTSPDPRPPSPGLDVSVLQSLPAFTFSSKYVPCECAVCLSEFEEGDVGRQLPNCGHSFHMACIDEWFGSNASCPLCRDPLDWQGKQVVVVTMEEDDMQGTAGDSGLSRASYSSWSCLVAKMEERCEELEKMGFCFAEGKRSKNSLLSMKRIRSV